MVTYFCLKGSFDISLKNVNLRKISGKQILTQTSTMFSEFPLRNSGALICKKKEAFFLEGSFLLYFPSETMSQGL
jgi:hypothetical protein